MAARAFEYEADSAKGAVRLLADADVTFLAVETPAREDGSIDPSALLAAAEDVGRAIADKPDYHLVVVKSTVLPDVILPDVTT